MSPRACRSTGNVVSFWDAGDNVVRAVLDCREELNGRQTVWRWNLLDELFVKFALSNEVWQRWLDDFPYGASDHTSRAVLNVSRWHLKTPKQPLNLLVAQPLRTAASNVQYSLSSHHQLLGCV
jgi:hypothetical protein